MTFHFKKHPFVWTIILLALLFYSIKNIQGRFKMHDLEVDYTAAQHLLHGQQIYHQSFGLKTAVYKYSPFTLFLLIPLAVLPFFFAKTLYFFITVGLIIAVTLFLERFLTGIFFQDKPLGCQNILFWATLVVATHYDRELGLGNHNVLLLLGLVGSLNLILKQNETLAGILIGLVILMKPHFLVLLPLFLLRPKIKTLTRILECLLFGLLFPAIFVGWQKNLDLHAAWLDTMFAHNENINFTRNTLQAWLYKVLIKFIYPPVGMFYALGIILGAAGLVFLFVLWNYANERKSATAEMQDKLAARDFSFEYLLLIAMVPNLFVTDSEHFLWSLPIIMFIWSYLLYEQKRRDMRLYCSIVIFVLYGGDWYALWGRALSRWIETTGFLGLGNLLMLLNAVYLFHKFCHEPPQPRS